MKIAITGSTGFIGQAAAHCALSRGHKIVRITRPGATLQGPNDISADLEDAERLTEIASQVDAVVHCAASDEPAFLPISRTAIDALISGLPPGSRFAMHGGSVVFGDTGPEPVATPEFGPPPPLQERAALEQHVLQSARSDISTRIVYGSLIFGGEGAAIPTKMIHVAMEQGTSFYFGEGDQVWSSAHVHDFGALLIDAVENDVPQNLALFAAGRAVQIKPVADIIAQVLGVGSRPVETDEEAELFGPFAGALSIHQHFSSEPARRLFRWCPEMSDEGAAIVRALTIQTSRTVL
ncbi:MAG: NAD-dependent epimerase/dehydratase family protein [Pseudomonadota bacterium]